MLTGDKQGTVQYSTVQYSTVQYVTVNYSTAQYSTVQCSAVQYSTVQYSTVLSSKATHDVPYNPTHCCTSLHEGDCGNTDDALYITA